jgi:hypothetical protein
LTWCAQMMDSHRLLHFAIEQKLKKELPTSHRCIDDLCQSKLKVESIIDQNSSVGLIALCDLLTTMILAMDEYQRINVKPTIDVSKKSNQHTDKTVTQMDGSSEEGQDEHDLKKGTTSASNATHGTQEVSNEHKIKAEKTSFDGDLEIDPSELSDLEIDSEKHGYDFAGNA